MRITIVHDWLTGYRGGEKCLELLCKQFPHATLYTLVHVPGSVPAVIEDRPVRTSFLNRLPGVRHYYRALLPLAPLAVEQLRIKPDVDLVVSFSHAVAGRVIPPKGVPHVCYCFTPMRYAWHLREEYLPRGAALPRRAMNWLAGRMLDGIATWDRGTTNRVTRFVACSQAVARRIHDCYDRSSEVIYPPVDTEFYHPGNVPRGEEYLFASALVPYKRLDLAIEATARLGRRLVVIGDGPLRRRSERGAAKHVHFLGRVDDATLRYWLRRSRALLFPGREDFGIVPLEAQACGTPVIALGSDGALETVLPATDVTPGTGLLFTSPTAASLVECMQKLERGEVLFDPLLARAHAERFSRARFERELLECLQQTMTESSASHREPRGVPSAPHLTHSIRKLAR